MACADIQLDQLVCRYFYFGHCNDGNFCPFPHVSDPDKVPDKVCRYFLKNCCWFGTICMFQHVQVLQEGGKYVLRISRKEKARIQDTSNTAGNRAAVSSTRTKTTASPNKEPTRSKKYKSKYKRNISQRKSFRGSVSEESQKVKDEQKDQDDIHLQRDAASYPIVFDFAQETGEARQDSMVSQNQEENLQVYIYYPNSTFIWAPSIYFASNPQEERQNFQTDSNALLGSVQSNAPVLLGTLPNQLAQLNITEHFASNRQEERQNFQTHSNAFLGSVQSSVPVLPGTSPNQLSQLNITEHFNQSSSSYPNQQTGTHLAFIQRGCSCGFIYPSREN